MERVLLKIVKKIPVDNNGHYRWYAAYCTTPPKQKMRAPMFYLDETQCRTEKDLCYLIYKSYGIGEFRVMAWRKGRKGVFTFWIGEINDEGFSFRIRKTNSSKTIDKLKESLAKAKDEDEREFILQDIEFEKEFKDLTKTDNTLYGFQPHLKPSGKRGTFIRWEDQELSSAQAKDLNDDWRNPEQITKKVEMGDKDDWGLKKLNRKQVLDEFDKWE